MTEPLIPPAPKIESAKEMLGIVSLKNVEFYEVSAKSNESEPDGDNDEVAPQFELRLQQHGTQFRVRLRVSFSAARGAIAVDAAVVYELEEDIEIRSDVALDFANHVGMMALLPDLREAVHGITVKVFGEGLLMPIMKAGDLEFNQGEVASPNTNV